MRNYIPPNWTNTGINTTGTILASNGNSLHTVYTSANTINLKGKE